MRDAPTVGDELEALLGRLTLLRSVNVERRGPRAIVTSAERVVATFNVETGTVTADVKPDLLGWLLDDLPQLTRTAAGVQLRVTDESSGRAAEALVRWRVETERYASQLRSSSP